MFKKILMSGLVLGALATLVGGASYAAWSDTATGTGTISAANIDIQIDAPNVSDLTTLTFSPSQAILPGETQTDTFTIDNVGTRAVTLVGTAVATSSDETNCPNGWLTPLTVTGMTSPLAVSGSTVGTVSATLHPAAPIGCMGVTFTVTVTVTGTGV